MSTSPQGTQVGGYVVASKLLQGGRSMTRRSKSGGLAVPLGLALTRSATQEVVERTSQGGVISTALADKLLTLASEPMPRRRRSTTRRHRGGTRARKHGTRRHLV